MLLWCSSSKSARRLVVCGWMCQRKLCYNFFASESTVVRLTMWPMQYFSCHVRRSSSFKTVCTHAMQAFLSYRGCFCKTAQPQKDSVCSLGTATKYSLPHRKKNEHVSSSLVRAALYLFHIRLVEFGKQKKKIAKEDKKLSKSTCGNIQHGKMSWWYTISLQCFPSK